MKTGDGFGNTWLTNWRLADAAPKRTLLLTFFGTALGVALGDYFISGGARASGCVGVGIACGLIVATLAYRKMRTYERTDRR